MYTYMYIKNININKAHKKRSSMMRINCDMARKFEFLVAVYVKQINAEQKNFFLRAHYHRTAHLPENANIIL